VPLLFIGSATIINQFYETGFFPYKMVHSSEVSIRIFCEYSDQFDQKHTRHSVYLEGSLMLLTYTLRLHLNNFSKKKKDFFGEHLKNQQYR
jgi:hypothetical protein